LDIYLINLDRRKDRLSEFEARNGHLQLNFLRFPGVEGRGLARNLLVDRGIISADLVYTDAMLGCALSHFALWDLGIEQNQTLTVCEDDAIFNRGFGPAAASLLDLLPPGWHIVLWGWNFDSVLLFDMLPGVSPCLGVFNQDNLRAGVDAFQSTHLTPLLFRMTNAFGTVGYSVSPMGALALKQHCLPLRNMEVFIPGLRRTIRNSSIDIMLNAAYFRLNAYACFPPLIITENVHNGSTIQQTP
jgi:GR25 family glycosyltransferase involved in LPS biosynthesis